ncbi:hypothetical protein NDU88_003649 [Pleurodeles waltl]|uniref:Uncharacterized protein n=1 Tax=Pleurodeles waltl TaxID=8319 RepID=A0AAV7W2S3_PLEWA|nr:hypothetical protein NDU88_003649 [Pleurodeles waltl]
MPGAAESGGALRLLCTAPAACGGPSLRAGTRTGPWNGPSAAVVRCCGERLADLRHASAGGRIREVLHHCYAPWLEGSERRPGLGPERRRPWASGPTPIPVAYRAHNRPRERCPEHQALPSISERKTELYTPKGSLSRAIDLRECKLAAATKWANQNWRKHFLGQEYPGRPNYGARLDCSGVAADGNHTA